MRSTEGEGSEFTVRLPLGTAHLPADQVSEESLEPAASIAALFVEEAMSWIEAPGDAPLAAAEAGCPPATATARGGRAC